MFTPEHLLDPYDTDETFSLTLVRKLGSILLGRKTRNFGTGKLVAPGGKDTLYPRARMNPTRSGLVAAQKEVMEETGLNINAKDFARVGRIDSWDEEMEARLITVYEAPCPPDAKLRQTDDEDELKDLRWYPTTDIPYSDMPPDYLFWLPLYLAGHSFEASFFDRSDNLVHGRVTHQQVTPTLERSRRFDIVDGQAVAIRGLQRVPSIRRAS